MPAGGHNKHIPTDEQRIQVAALVSFGVPLTEIASFIDIHPDTLSLHYRRELDTAVTIANANVAKRLYNKAVNQDDLSAQVFWLKTRARWRTTDKDVETLSTQNAELQAELMRIRIELEAKNKRDY